MRGEKVGGEAADRVAVHTLKGVTPRSHDHRGRWTEFFDTFLSNTSTIRNNGWRHPARNASISPRLPNPSLMSRFRRSIARFNGYPPIDDCLGTWPFCSRIPKLVLECFNAVTGWDWSLKTSLQLWEGRVRQSPQGSLT